MKLENAELKHIERIVAISKAAFDSDIHVGASEPDAPPDYDSIPWHIQMKNEGHLFQVVMAGEIVGGAILFVDKDGETLYIGRIFIDPVHHRKGYGLSLMKMVETYYPGIKKIQLDTPLWNVRTNAFLDIATILSICFNSACSNFIKILSMSNWNLTNFFHIYLSEGWFITRSSGTHPM